MPDPEPAVTISKVGRTDLFDLVPLMRAYCEFYDVAPRDDRLSALARALLEDPSQGLQLLARGEGTATALGFATIYWSWSTLDAARIGVMNDLFVVPEARGAGVGRLLIAHCRAACRRRGASKLEWATAPDNHSAQRLYDSTGATATLWKTYELDAW